MFDERQYDKVLKTISIEKANQVGLKIILPVFLLFTIPHVLLHGEAMLAYFRTASDPMTYLRDGAVFLAAFFIGIVLHECIHGVTWALFAPGGFRSIRFGVLWKYLTPYCHCTEPLKIKHYRLGALMPALLLGLIPAVAGVAAGEYRITLFGIFFITAAIGDFMVIHLLKDEKADDYALDHPSEAGCFVYRRRSNLFDSHPKM